MRKRNRVVLALLVVVAGLFALSGAAFAGTITTPSTSPFAVPGDGSGNPQPFTVVGSGFAPNTNVFAIICDGVPASDPSWDPNADCDNLTAPAPVKSNASGVATFTAGDPNATITPFKGASPNQLFNCLAPNDPPSSNGLTDYKNCQIKLSSNNTAATADQAFVTLTLPNASTPPPDTPETKYVILLPIAAAMAIGGFVIIRRRRSHAAA